MKSIKKGRKLSNGIIYAILSVMAVIWVLPIVWLILRSLQAEPRRAWIPTVLPQPYVADGVQHGAFSFDNYIRLFTERDLFDYPQWFLNTLIVAILTCALSTLMVLMISYTFSRLRFKSRKGFMNVGLVLGMFPGFMTMIAVYHILKAIGLYQSLISLVLVYSTTAALSYFIAKGFFDTIPKALDEAATLDGATKNQIFWRITLPMSKPIVIYTALTSFMAPWVDFVFASVIMKDNYSKYTLAVGLFRMLERENINQYFTRFCAGAVLVAIPITALFIVFQKYYVEGVTGGATKG